MTQTMKTFVLKGHGDFDQLQWHEDWPLLWLGEMKL